MIRTVWLALFCLGGISALASVKFVSSAWGTRVETPSAQSEKASVGRGEKNQDLAKADRLAANVELASLETTPVIPVMINPVHAGVERRTGDTISSRHWHEPAAFARTGNSTMKVKSKTRDKRKIVSVRPRGAECSVRKPETILQALNRSGHCRVASTLPTKRAIIAK
jgi:hypothetical protein